MNRRLQNLNLCGVLVLAIVCVLQWRRDRALNLEVNRIETTRLEQKEKITEQEKHLRGLTDDLASYQEQLGRARTELSESQKNLQEMERVNQRLSRTSEQLTQSVTNWANAVTERDKRLGEANGRIHELADQLNASVLKFNELATNYDTVVKALNQARAGKSNTASAAGSP